MKLTFATATALALTAGLAACGKPAPERAAAPPEAASPMAASTTPASAAPTGDMGKMAMPAPAGAGTPVK